MKRGEAEGDRGQEVEGARPRGLKGGPPFLWQGLTTTTEQITIYYFW